MENVERIQQYVLSTLLGMPPAMQSMFLPQRSLVVTRRVHMKQIYEI